MINSVCEGWTDPNNWKLFVDFFYSYETYIVLFVSLIVPFWITYRSGILSNSVENYFHNRSIYNGIFSDISYITSKIDEVNSFIRILSNYRIVVSSRNIKFSNRERDYIQEQMLKSLYCLKSIKHDTSGHFYNSKKINLNVKKINNYIDRIFIEEDYLKKERIINKDLFKLTPKLNKIVDITEDIYISLEEFQIYLEKELEWIDRSKKRADKIYNVLKFLPYWILIVLSFLGVFKNGVLKELALWSIYSFVLYHAYKVVFAQFNKYKFYE